MVEADVLLSLLSLRLILEARGAAAGVHNHTTLEQLKEVLGLCREGEAAKRRRLKIVRSSCLFASESKAFMVKGSSEAVRSAKETRNGEHKARKCEILSRIAAVVNRYTARPYHIERTKPKHR